MSSSEEKEDQRARGLTMEDQRKVVFSKEEEAHMQMPDTISEISIDR